MTIHHTVKHIPKNYSYVTHRPTEAMELHTLTTDDAAKTTAHNAPSLEAANKLLHVRIYANW